METMAMGRLYSYGRPDKMSVPIQTPPSPPEVKYDDSYSLGPYYANYWNLVGPSIDSDGVPVASNGSYISPYGTTTAEPFFASAIHAPEMPVMEELPWHNGCNDGLFTHSRSSSYNQATQANPYSTPPLDGTSWNPYGTVTDPNLDMIGYHSLENLATQILTTVVSISPQDFVNIVSNPGDEGKGQAYATVEALFHQQRRPHCHKGRLFISPSQRAVTSPELPRIVRKTNLATFVAAIFRGQDIPYMDLDESFLNVFMPFGTRLLKNESALWLELKTQAFITIMMNGGASKDDVLNKLFPTDLSQTIMKRRAEPTHLAPSEQDFVNRCQIRRQYLEEASQSVESLVTLPQKYSWQDFLEKVAHCVKHVLDSLENSKQAMTSSMVEDPITKATIAAHAAISSHPHGHMRSISQSSIGSNHSANLSMYQPMSAYHFGDAHASLSPPRTYRGTASASSVSPTTPTATATFPLTYPRTSHPTKSLSNGRRTTAPSPRRPWTSEEEKALLDGLERVKGPHWSQILALYGAGGSISEVLKDRNQVQLKDKARNLKLFFLKSGVEVPGHLKRVTGELRTRAPGQAARRERERKREEEQKRQQARMENEARQQEEAKAFPSPTV